MLQVIGLHEKPRGLLSSTLYLIFSLLRWSQLMKWTPDVEDITEIQKQLV